MMNVLKVRFHHEDASNCSQIFVGCLNKKFYSRSEEGKWYTVSCDGGLFERDCHIKNEITVQVIGKNGEVLLEESNGKTNKAPFPFLDAYCKEKSKVLKQLYNLLTYDEWKKVMVNDMNQYQYKGYTDNWLFGETVSNKNLVIEKFNYLDQIVEVIATERIHGISKRTFITIDMRLLGEQIKTLAGMLLDISLDDFKNNFLKKEDKKTKEFKIVSLGDDFVCDCGNHCCSDGFYSCNDEGIIIEPLIHSDWNGKYVCARCKRVYLNQEKL